MSVKVDRNSMFTLLSQQQESFKKAGYPDLEIRISRLDRLLAMLKKYDRQICKVVAEDFGTRPEELTLLAEVYATIEHAKDAIINVEQWMSPEQRKAMSPGSDAGATAQIRFMPKGVVGIIGPWNFPVHLVIAPLVCVLAAGNRAMIKPSSVTPKTAELIGEMIAEFFDPTEVTVISGNNVSDKFTKLPFDHIVFTGSTDNGRHVMRAAADNLTPVTLELGGKSPVIIDKCADLSVVALRIITGKLFNSGQVCVCPDYAFVPEAMLPALLIELENAVKILYPTIENNPDYTSIVNQNHFRRIQNLLDDANEKGVEIVTFNPADENYDESVNRKLLPRVLVNPSDETAVMKEEIFGPLLPLKSYNQLDEVIEYLHTKDHPLALYYFGENETNKALLRDNILSGGMTVNDVVVQVICDQLPFGGVGASGMGRYHGIEGFIEFSHLKGVYTQTPSEEIAGFMRPPYNDTIRDMLEKNISEA
ncbi:MAG: coniferyl aldehyde dehydrogenase [Colwellia sp.]|uniref:coniferyl aldehyde dehydrogenase n=1 Tax=Colwellia sp. TaxID=56799 RepID=UPI001D424417|nr:coniferyl aldehyde dehydrogenase [Colwellia sp.]NQY48120.1 coniferyl aldehyde dehydrogenase [Colwellia sp.]